MRFIFNFEFQANFMKQGKRLQILDELIREGHYPNWGKLGKGYLNKGESVWDSKRTFEGDIRTLKNELPDRYPNISDGHLLYSKKEPGYKYHPDVTGLRDFRISDLKAVASIAQQLLNFKHFIISDTIQNSLEQLNSYAKVFAFERDKKKIGWEPVEFIQEGKKEGHEHFETVLKAISELREIVLEHNRYGKESTTYKRWTVLPLLLKEWNNSWYLLALEDIPNGKFPLSIDNLRIFGLNRINKIVVSDKVYKDKITNLKSFKPAKYWENIYGIINPNLNKKADNTIYKIVLSTKEDWLRGYLEKNPIHPTKKIIKNDPESPELKIQLMCKINPELISFILGFSPDLVVESPKTLKDLVKGRLRQSLEIYK